MWVFWGREIFFSLSRTGLNLRVSELFILFSSKTFQGLLRKSLGTSGDWPSLATVSVSHLWWFISCVSLTGHGLPRLNIISGSVSGRVFPDGVRFEPVGSADCTPQFVWASSTLLRVLVEQKVKEGRICSSPHFLHHCVNGDISSHLPSSLGWDHRLLQFSGLSLRLNFTIGFSGSSGYRQQITGILSLYNAVS